MLKSSVPWPTAGALLLALLLRALLPSSPVVASEPSTPPPSLVVVTISSLRSDRVEPGSERGSHMPYLQAMGQRGALLARARTPVPETIPALASLFTGLDPSHHGVYEDNRAASGVVSLAQRLADRGYTNSAWLGDTDVATTPFLTRGIKDVHALPEHSATALATAVVNAAGNSLADGSRFIWVHLSGASAPYIPQVSDLLAIRAEARNKAWRFSLAVSSRPGTPHMLPAAAVNGPIREAGFYLDSYDAVVRELDRAIEIIGTELAPSLAASGGYLVVASVHGESLGEHGQWLSHGHTLYEEELLVPICLLGPDIKPLPEPMESSWASLNDLTPTLSDLLGLETSRGRVGDGYNLASRLRTSSAPPGRSITSGQGRPPYSQALLSEGRFKLIVTPPRPPVMEDVLDWPAAGRRELYDLHGDSLESKNLAKIRGNLSHDLALFLRRHYPPWPKSPPALDRSRVR
ncbi:MAG: sulfatase-like hydrolase/transferase [Acidobacteria bacterium]|nr:sulfatase-like hydrolase/transferase [Acidobacteriota bacterium]